ncbi:hypothetical protein [Enterobacter sp. Bisph1]|uniref:hypothetical protein n=1 Tax=Enterobacter sp. Bisph1 TaxID=1274399 RepID=UPI00057BDDF5|nr:hypothetical protein [Enterobacter sp. Bisph1]
MHNHSKIILFSLVLFFSASCSISRPVNKTLSPPSDTKWINIEIKNPSPYTKPFPLEARYISYSCQKKRISGFDGSIITEPSYNVIGIPMLQEGGDIWRAKVAMIGGGSCKWTLNVVDLGIEYIDATHLDKELVPGTAVGARIAFDNDSSQNGQYSSAHGDLYLSPKYYPFISEWNLGEKKKELSLLGKKSFLHLRAYETNQIKFYPELDETKVVRYIGIEKKIEGARSKIIYPDGSVGANGEIFPDFDKVDKMKLP